MVVTTLRGALLPAGFPINTTCRIGQGVRWWNAPPPEGDAAPIAFALGLKQEVAHAWGLRSGVYVRLMGDFQSDALVLSPDRNPDSPSAQPAIAWYGRTATDAEGLLLAPTRFSGAMEIVYREDEATPVLFKSDDDHEFLPANSIFAGAIAADIPTRIMPTMRMPGVAEDFRYSACHFARPAYILADTHLLLLVPRPAYVVDLGPGQVRIRPSIPPLAKSSLNFNFDNDPSGNSASLIGSVSRDHQGTPPNIVRAFTTAEIRTSATENIAQQAFNILERAPVHVTAFDFAKDPEDGTVMTEAAFYKIVHTPITGASFSGSRRTIGSVVHDAQAGSYRPGRATVY